MNLQRLIPPQLIRANAGTGKTFSLSNRFLTLLACGENPDKILATTFTRKAAGEIYERVFVRLAKAAQNKVDAEELSHHLGIALTTEASQQLLKTLVNQQHRLQICTLDSFFIQIASSFVLELGLPPNWMVSDEQQNSNLYVTAVGELCFNSEQSELRQLLQLLSIGETKSSVFEYLKTQLTGLDELRRLTSREAWNWIEPAKQLGQLPLVELLSEIRNLSIPNTKGKTPNQHWQSAKDSLIEIVQKEEWRELFKNGLIKKILNKESSYSRANIEEGHISSLRPILEVAKCQTLEQIRLQTLALYALLTSYGQIIDTLRDSSGLLSFDDIKHKLRDNLVAGQIDELYYRLDSRISHLLLDEFQDTSLVQWQVLQPIAEEILSKADGQSSFFCVGDSKQAIYGWRGGIAEIFDSLEQSYPLLTGHSTELAVSYRSAPIVIACVNRIFKAISQFPNLGELESLVTQWTSRYTEHHTTLANAPGYIELHSIESTVDSDDGTLLQAAKKALELHAINPSCKIAVLVRSNNNVEALLGILSHLAPAVPTSGEGGSSLIDSPAIGTLLALLRLVDHPGDSILAYTVANSVIGRHLEFSIHSSREALDSMAKRVRATIDRDGLAETLSAYVEAIQPHCNARDNRRLRQFIELTHSYDASRLTRLSDFADWITSKKLEDPLESSIRIMTIHKSKGLEFDAVILPFENDDIAGKNSQGVILSSSVNPLLPPSKVVKYVSKDLCTLLPEFDQMHRQRLSQQISESLSVLYVALTRARHGLYLFIPHQPSKSITYSNLLRFSLASEVSEPGLIYADGDSNWISTLSSQHEQVKLEILEVTNAPLLAPISGQRQRILPRITPSTLKPKQEPYLNPLTQINSKSNALRGEAMHRIFQTLEWVESYSQIYSILNRVCLARDQEWHEECLSLLLNPEISNLFIKSGYPSLAEVSLYRELKFAVSEKQGILVGTIDRLVVYSDTNQIKKVDLIDFKTDQISATNSQLLAQRIEHYTPQLQAYRRAAAKFAKIPATQVTSRLAFVSCGLVVEVQ